MRTRRRALQYKIPIIFILSISGLLIAYFAYRVTENYFYLQKEYFSLNITDTNSQRLAGALILQNTVTGKIDTVNLLHGKFILNFSATWCKPCLEEVPLLNILHWGQSPNHYKLYCILEQRSEVINTFARKHKVPFNTYILLSPLPQQLDYTLIPTTVICKEGSRELRITGKLTPTDVASMQKKLAD